MLRNTDPFAPWNSPMYDDDPRAPWNHPAHRDDPTAPWNDPVGRKEDLERYEHDYGYSGRDDWDRDRW